ncbi:MAG TPA: LLM class flavin-dependent oxidoreductase [Phototrophicaceae bacterium]|nr:LLM class flavin-dependent oxidoreductase [Phototrophicaceae bacterium]
MMSASTPTLGVIFHPRFPPETLMDYARRAEQAGFSELWLWDDCFLPGAFTSAAIALTATERLKVGIGLLPATVYNPLFAAMEITTLARAFPGRFLPGFGYGVDTWMKQIGAAPTSAIKTLEQTVQTIRALLRGDQVSVDQHNIHLDQVQMQLTAEHQPPLYIGAMREKTLQLTGRVADGTILTGMSSPAYVRWAREQINIGLKEREQPAHQHRVVVYALAKISPDGAAAQATMRQAITPQFGFWADVHLQALGVLEAARALQEQHGADAGNYVPDAWINELTITGTPEQAVTSISRLADAGADAIILQPLENDPACLDEYIRYLMPLYP